MFNKLLPFTLIASFALPFLAKADETIISKGIIAPPPLTKQQCNFMRLVEVAVLIETAGDFEPEKIDSDIKIYYEQAVQFLQAVKEELQKMGITIKNSNPLLLTLHSRKLNSTVMKQLEEKYVTDDMKELLKYITPQSSPANLPAIMLLAAMATQN